MLYTSSRSPGNLTNWKLKVSIGCDVHTENVHPHNLRSGGDEDGGDRRLCEKRLRVYKATWKPTLHEELQCRKEDNNPNDPYVIAVIKGDAMVGLSAKKTTV